MSVYDLKTWPEFFDSIVDGHKTFEVRYDDRGIEVGDSLRLREWHPRTIDIRTGEPCTEGYTGRSIDVVVTYRMELDDAPAFPLDLGDDYEGAWVVLAIRVLGVVTEATP